MSNRPIRVLLAVVPVSFVAYLFYSGFVSWLVTFYTLRLFLHLLHELRCEYLYQRDRGCYIGQYHLATVVLYDGNESSSGLTFALLRGIYLFVHSIMQCDYRCTLYFAVELDAPSEIEVY